MIFILHKQYIMQCYLCYYFFTHKKNLSSLSQYHHITISYEYFTSTQELAFTHLLINGSMSCLITPLTHCQPYTHSFSHTLRKVYSCLCYLCRTTYASWLICFCGTVSPWCVCVWTSRALENKSKILFNDSASSSGPSMARKITQNLFMYIHLVHR